ncbi:MAG: hypothetical protein PHT33_01345 [bacterium]|nr:hypothetical protein [bacterium]
MSDRRSGLRRRIHYLAMAYRQRMEINAGRPVGAVLAGSFIAGLGRGLGLVLGATLAAVLLAYILGHLTN